MSTEKKTKEIEKTDIYQEDLKYLETAVKTAWSRYSGQGKTEKKGVKDLVTDADFAIENYLIGAIRERYPEDSFLTEETNTNERLSGRTWTIDPIDGTINFAYGIPLYFGDVHGGQRGRRVSERGTYLCCSASLHRKHCRVRWFFNEPGTAGAAEKADCCFAGKDYENADVWRGLRGVRVCCGRTDPVFYYGNKE